MKKCLNCYIDYTPMWRNGHCNACWIHYSKYGIHKNIEEIYAKILIDISKDK